MTDWLGEDSGDLMPTPAEMDLIRVLTILQNARLTHCLKVSPIGTRGLLFCKDKHVLLPIALELIDSWSGSTNYHLVMAPEIEVAAGIIATFQWAAKHANMVHSLQAQIDQAHATFATMEKQAGWIGYGKDTDGGGGSGTPS